MEANWGFQFENEFEKPQEIILYGPKVDSFGLRHSYKNVYFYDGDERFLDIEYLVSDFLQVLEEKVREKRKEMERRKTSMNKFPHGAAFL